MTAWYEVRRCSNDIFKAEISKETEKFLFFPSGRRELKVNSFARWFKSRDEAVVFLKQRLIAKIKRCVADREEAESALRLL